MVQAPGQRAFSLPAQEEFAAARWREEMRPENSELFKIDIALTRSAAPGLLAKPATGPFSTKDWKRERLKTVGFNRSPRLERHLA
jgi:hypothetical protein